MQFVAPADNGFVRRTGPSRGAGRAASRVYSPPLSPRGNSARFNYSRPLSPRSISSPQRQSWGLFSGAHLSHPRILSSSPLRQAPIIHSVKQRDNIVSTGASVSVGVSRPQVGGVPATVCVQPPLSVIAKRFSSAANDAQLKTVPQRIPFEPAKRTSEIAYPLRNSASSRSHFDRDSSASTLAPTSSSARFSVLPDRLVPPEATVESSLETQVLANHLKQQGEQQTATCIETQLPKDVESQKAFSFSTQVSNDVESQETVSFSTNQIFEKINCCILRPKLCKYVRVIQAVIRLQALAEVPTLPEATVETMLQRIRFTLATDKAYRQACEDVFNNLKLSCVGDNGILVCKLPLSHLEQVLNRWQVPHDHISIFWSILRKSNPSTQDSVMPDMIEESVFSSALGTFLRRVRNKYSMHIARKDNFIVRNQRIFENEYQEKGTIGSGSFGECLWVEHRFTKRRYACKRISVTRDDVGKDEVEAELEVMKRLDHPNVLRVFEWFETDSMYALVLEPAYGGDLKGFLKNVKNEGDTDGLEESLVVQITLQVLHALAYMHSQQVVHRDVKPPNMLLANELNVDYTVEDLSGVHVLLADFGLAGFFGEDFESHNPSKTSKEKKTAPCGTLAYMALEVFNGEASAASDMWALGVSVYELFTNHKPIKGDNQMAFYVALKRKEVDLQAVRDKNVSDGAVQFLEEVFKREASLRPTAKGALDMQWFSQWSEGAANTSLLAQKKYKKAVSRFRRSTTFCKAVSVCAAAQLDSSRVAELNKLFKAIDKDGQGTLSLDEVKEGLAQIGLEGADGDSIFDALDIDRDGIVNYSEFVACLIPTQGILDGELLARAFHIFDTDGDGTISLRELGSMLCGQGPVATMLPEGTTVQDMLKDIDSSGDGVISYEEFKSYFHKQQEVEHRRNSADAIDLADFVLHAESSASLSKASALRGQSSRSILSDPTASQHLENDQVPIRNVFEDLSTRLSMQCSVDDLPDSVTLPDFQALCEEHAHRLAEQHWLVYVSDLHELQPGDWSQLGLPLKLQNMLKSHIGVE